MRICLEILLNELKKILVYEFVNTISFNFSTSNKITKVIGYISIMSTIKKYFKFKGIGYC